MIFDNILGLLSVDMGIDLGTANTLVCIEGEGVVLDEPSVVAVRKGTNRVLNGAIGVAAKEMLGKTPGSIVAIRPLKDGVIADFDITQSMLSYFMRKVQKRTYLYKPRVVIAVPSGITAVERRAVVNSAERAGARKVYLIEEPIAAGMGVGLPIMEPVGSMIVDVGGGTTEVAVTSLGGIVTSESIRIAGDEMDDAIISYLKRTYNLMVGEQSAERIKIGIGSAYPLEEERVMDVKGRDLMAGLPRKVEITSQEIREALRDPVSAIIEAIKMTLERTAPELAADLVDRGLTMAGGGALLRGLDKVIAQETGLPVTVDSDPLTAVARGTGVFLENLDRYSKAIESEEDEG
ncbi:MAG: rod shape-determining protein [Planctomycetes bacterium]|nr:rod shape-determining protein [Planctomycetota bacterium]